MAREPKTFCLELMAQLVVIGDVTIVCHCEVWIRSSPEGLSVGRIDLRLRCQPQVGDTVRSHQRTDWDFQPFYHADGFLDRHTTAHSRNGRPGEPGFQGLD